MGWQRVTHRTASEWTAGNYTLLNNELGVESDTQKQKLGDGTTTWTSLGYNSSSSPASIGGSVETALEFDRTYHQHVNHGYYWRRDIAHSKFFYEAWVNIATGAEYVISDGYGGAHNLLWGFDGASGGHGLIIGNVWINGGTVSFSSIDRIWAGDWHHIAVGWDGNFIRTYIDGVYSKAVAATGLRKTTGDPSEGCLCVGGSNHSNYAGKIKSIRGFEGWCPIGAASYIPFPSFTTAFVDAAGVIRSASFLADYSKPQNIIPDLSDGYTNGTRQQVTNTVVVTTVVAGNAKCVVTANGMSNSPKTVTFAVAGSDSASQVATKARTALAADTDVASFFTVAGTGADISLVAIYPNDNDATMNLTIEDATSSGITDDTTAVQTVAGIKGERIRHVGIRANELDGALLGNFGLSQSAGTLGNLPQFVSAQFEQPSVFRGTPLSIPGSAVAFDDFSRANVTKLWGDTLALGTSRTGQVWVGDTNIGIIDGSAFAHTWSSIYGPKGAYLEHGGTNQDVRISRRGTDDGVGLSLRHTDQSNRILAAVASGQYAFVYDVVAGTPTVITGLNGLDIGSTSWTELRVVVSGSTVTLYADGVSLGSGTTAIATGTKCGFDIYSMLARVDTFTAL